MNAWLTRKSGTEDIEMLQREGGVNWLVRGTNTDPASGIEESTIQEREKRWGSNRKKVVPLKTFWEWVSESLEDFTL